MGKTPFPFFLLVTSISFITMAANLTNTLFAFDAAKSFNSLINAKIAVPNV